MNDHGEWHTPHLTSSRNLKPIDVVLRLEFPAVAPAPAALNAATLNLWRSLTELGYTPTRPVTCETTDIDEDGVQSLTTRWVLARTTAEAA